MIPVLIVLAILLLTTYVFFPAAVLLAARRRKGGDTETATEFRGRIHLFMAARNEAAVLPEKLESLLHGSFPADRLVCHIGSDASDDATDDIIRSYAGRLDIRFRRFEARTGKPAIINALVKQARSGSDVRADDLFLLTDANVFHETDHLTHLARVFSDPETGLADGVAVDSSEPAGLAGSEQQYLHWETRLKAAEGRLWGCAMGPFGGAYMIRPQLYRPVPYGFLVDDFFIFYHVLASGFKSRVAEDALCREAVSDDLGEEFRRKVRIAAGNWQNVRYYAAEMVRIWKVHNLVFILHKLLRWCAPWFALAALVLLAVRAPENQSARMALVIMISLLLGGPLLNYLLNQVNLRWKWLQGWTYFLAMNAALLAGTWKFLKGIDTNVWEPTNRKT